MERIGIDRIMTGNHSRVHFVKESENIKDAAKKMLQLNISALPVMGEKAEIVGLITSKDVMQSYVSFDEPPLVSSVMVKEFITVKKTDSIHHVSRLMNKLGVHHMIVEHKGLVCGILSCYDFLKLSNFKVKIESEYSKH